MTHKKCQTAPGNIRDRQVALPLCLFPDDYSRDVTSPTVNIDSSAVKEYFNLRQLLYFATTQKQANMLARKLHEK